MATDACSASEIGYTTVPTLHGSTSHTKPLWALIDHSIDALTDATRQLERSLNACGVPVAREQILDALRERIARGLDDPRRPHSVTRQAPVDVLAYRE